MKQLHQKRIAILATNGFEQSELFEPKRALEEAGATCLVVSPKTGSIRAWDHDKWGESIEVNTAIGQVSAGEFDALLIPGGVLNPDKLRQDSRAVNFVREFFELGKPVAAICHGPWLLVEADVVRGRRLTSYTSIQTDLKNAGAHWVDQAVVIDGELVTSRKPEDLPQFIAAIIEEFRSEAHEPVTAQFI